MFSKPSLFLLLIVTLLLSSTACSEFSRLQKSKDWRVKYQAAVVYYEAEKYFKASQLLEEVVPLAKGNVEAASTEFYLAYCKFYQKEYLLSAYYFKNFYETYPSNSQVEEALYMHGHILSITSPDVALDQSITEEGIEILQQYIHHYPHGAYHTQSAKYLKILSAKLVQKAYNNAKIYDKLANYHAATIALKNFQQDYPNDPLTEEASYVQLNSQYQWAKQVMKAEAHYFKKRSKTKQGRCHSISHTLVHFYTAIEYYHQFFDKYANSRYIHKAEEIYKACLTQIASLKKS